MFFAWKIENCPMMSFSSLYYMLVQWQLILNFKDSFIINVETCRCLVKLSNLITINKKKNGVVSTERQSPVIVTKNERVSSFHVLKCMYINKQFRASNYNLIITNSCLDRLACPSISCWRFGGQNKY